MNKSVVPLVSKIRDPYAGTPVSALSCLPDRNNTSAKEKTRGAQYHGGIVLLTSGAVKCFAVYGLSGSGPSG
ncbi:MAG TPA: hypothetical protein PK395_15640, partial [bacterium]|nr:hypothetical protein [bacterium]